MRMKHLLIAIGLALGASPAYTQTLPVGIYLFYSSETSPNTCYSNYNRGYLKYPGVGNTGTELEFISNALPGSVATASQYFYTISSFPAVPAGGLTSWTAGSPAGATETPFVSGTAGTPVTGTVYFTNLTVASPSTVTYTITTNLSLHCPGSEVLTLLGPVAP